MVCTTIVQNAIGGRHKKETIVKFEQNLIANTSFRRLLIMKTEVLMVLVIHLYIVCHCDFSSFTGKSVLVFLVRQDSVFFPINECFLKFSSINKLNELYQLMYYYHIGISINCIPSIVM